MILPFHGYQFALELQSARYQEKKLLRETIIKNGGEISYILTRKTNFVVVSKDCDTYKTRSALKCNIPVVQEQFIFDCDSTRKLLEPFDYLAKDDSKLRKFKKGCIVVEKKTETKPHPSKKPFRAEEFDWQDGKLKNLSDFTIFKFALYSGKLNDDVVTCALELQVSNENNNECFRIVKSSSRGTENVLEEVIYCLLDDVDFAERLYEHVYEKDRIKMQEFKKLNQLEREQSIGTPKLQMWLDEMKCMLGDVHPSVSQLLSTIWENAIGFTKSELVKNLDDITTENILNALAILKNMLLCLDQNEKMEQLCKEFFQCISFRKDAKINTLRDVSHMEEFCNLLFDIVQVSEVSSDTKLDAINFYRTIKCSINYVEPNSKEFMDVLSNLNISKPAGFNVCNIYKISRRDEENLESVFESCSNVRRLFHCSKQDNFVGILTNGLLLPDVTADKLGVHRSDPGRLGSGLYFTDSLTGSTSYSSVMKGRGTRYMLINDVALGECYETCKSDETLSSAPEGYQSVCGVTGEKSDFSFNEFVVYKTEQQRIKYLVEFTLKDDEMIDSSRNGVKSFNAEQLPTIKSQSQPFDLSTFKDPTFDTDLGLIVKEGGNRTTSVELKEVHVRGKLIDFSTEVHIFQVYVNTSSKTLEAKYVFPLTDNAAVCGFEAFINEKHVIGEVKEKEKAHKEYKEAVAAGHGAYLMDQDNANLFTVSVGNIPPNARVVIKISYISELNVTGGHDQFITFKLPGYIANSKQDNVLSKGGVTQTTTRITSVKNTTNIDTSLQLSLDMPFDILDIESVSHKIITKQTKTKACVKLSNSSCLDGNDFVLNVKVAEIHVPRMWIEEDEAHQASMISFYPEFEFDEIYTSEVIILLDMSNSIAACEKESKTVACSILSKLPKECHFNVIRFGSYFEEHYIVSKPNTDNNVASAKQFIIESQPIMGTSDVYQLMDTFTMMKRRNPVNIFLISDGGLDRKSKCSNVLMKFPASNCRVFPMGVGKGGDEHYLKVMANQAGGYYEYFDNQQKFKWISKIESQCEKANQPALCNAEIVWVTHDDPPSTPSNEFLPIKAPIQIKSIFGGTRVMAYSFVQNCSQAILKAKVGNRDFELMVSASTFNSLQGKSIHRLTAKNIINESEHENLHNVKTSHILLKKLQKQAIIDMSIKYSITSQYTSFVAIEKREKDENLSVRRGPSVQEILSDSTFDAIPEIEWDFSNEALSSESQVLNMLKNIAITETFSTLRARELALECSKVVLPKDHPYNLLQAANNLQKFDDNQTEFQVQQQSVTQTLSDSLLHNRNINYENIEAIMKNENQLSYNTAITDLVNFAFPMYSDLVCSLEVKLRPLFAGYILRFCRDKVMIEASLPVIRDCLDEGRNLKEAFSWCSDKLEETRSRKCQRHASGLVTLGEPRRRSSTQPLPQPAREFRRTKLLETARLKAMRVSQRYGMMQSPAVGQQLSSESSVERNVPREILMVGIPPCAKPPPERLPPQAASMPSVEYDVPRRKLIGGGPPGAKPPASQMNLLNQSSPPEYAMKRGTLYGGGGMASVRPPLMTKEQLSQPSIVFGSAEQLPEVASLPSVDNAVPRRKLIGGGPPGAKPPASQVSFQFQSSQPEYAMKWGSLRGGGGMAPVRLPSMVQEPSSQPAMLFGNSEQPTEVASMSTMPSVENAVPRRKLIGGGPPGAKPPASQMNLLNQSSQPEYAMKRGTLYGGGGMASVRPPLMTKEQLSQPSIVFGSAEQLPEVASLPSVDNAVPRRKLIGGGPPGAKPPASQVSFQFQSSQPEYAMKWGSLRGGGGMAPVRLPSMAKKPSSQPAMLFGSDEQWQQVQQLSEVMKDDISEQSKEIPPPIPHKDQPLQEQEKADSAPPGPPPPPFLWETAKKSLKASGIPPPPPPAPTCVNGASNNNFSFSSQNLQPMANTMFGFQQSMPSTNALRKVDVDYQAKVAEIKEIMKQSMEGLLDRSAICDLEDDLEESFEQSDVWEECSDGSYVECYLSGGSQSMSIDYRFLKCCGNMSEASSSEEDSECDFDSDINDEDTSGSSIEAPSFPRIRNMQSKIEDVFQKYSSDEMTGYDDMMLSEDNLYYPFCGFDILQTDKSDSEKDFLHNWVLEFLNVVKRDETIIGLLWLLELETLPCAIPCVKAKLRKIGLNSLPLNTQTIALELLHLSILVALFRLWYVTEDIPIPPKLKQILLKAKQRIITLDKANPSLYSTLDIGVNWYDSALQMLPCLGYRKIKKWATALLRIGDDYGYTSSENSL